MIAYTYTFFFYQDEERTIITDRYETSKRKICRKSHDFDHVDCMFIIFKCQSKRLRSNAFFDCTRGNYSQFFKFKFC